ncbi:hypothetical protein [Modestobacter sp. NPDC049651]|uniref:hypothetical protein n=1 Tax=Modestobacter sp. NPDC049651 TaxID=3155777 RepID=UPI0033C3FA9C
MNPVDVEHAEAALRSYFADKSVRARAEMVIFQCLNRDVTDAALILEEIRTRVLDERQRRLRGVQQQLERQVARDLAVWKTRQESPQSLAHAASGYLIDVLASGVLVNSIYDLLKAAVHVARKRRPKDPGAIDTAPPAKEVLTALALLSVIEQCGRHGIFAPAITDLRVTKWMHDSDSSTAYVKAGGRRAPDLDAEIVIPHEGLGHRGVKVTIRSSNRPATLTHDSADFPR